MSRKLYPLFILAALFTLLTGCSLKYAIDPPQPSAFTYQNVAAKPLVMKVIDRRDDPRLSPGISGLEKVSIVLQNMEDATGWLAHEMEREFNGRGVPVKVTTAPTANSDLTLTVKKFQVVNHRASGFSAWESYHLFLGELEMGDKKCTIPAFFSNSKIPVWSMDEVREPCLNLPLSVLVKEIVSKVNKCAFNYAASDEEVKKLEAFALANVKPETEYACLPSIALGSTNNMNAMKTLQKFAAHDDSLVHSCAISAIGTLGSENDFDFLNEAYFKVSNNDKIIPAKAIGDIGGKKGTEFLRNVMDNNIYRDEKGMKYCVDLYMGR